MSFDVIAQRIQDLEKRCHDLIVFIGQHEVLELLEKLIQQFIGNLPVNGQYQIFQFCEGVMLL